MKKLLKVASVCSVVVAAGVDPLVLAQEAPYILTQSINNVPVEKEDCVQLLREYAQNDEEDSHESQKLTKKIEELQQKLIELGEQFNRLNEEIAQIQSEELVNAQQKLEEVIEQVYSHRQSEEAFKRLSQEEQTQQLSEDESVIQWQEELETITQQLNDKVAMRDDIEQEYNQVQFDIEAHTTQLEKAKSTRSQFNQCMLYPYSTPVLSPETLLINAQTDSLESLLVQLDHYLQEIVPLAYRKVRYDDISLLFNVNRELAEVQEKLSGKHSIYLDEQGQYYYTYAREMNLLDVEILANLSLERYLTTGNLGDHISQYEMVLSIKEGQFDYFVELNVESIMRIKELLVNYLNDNELYDGETIELLRQFHQRYQFKCAVFNEGANRWQVVPNDETGYEAEYWHYDLKSLNQEDDEVVTPENETIEDEEGAEETDEATRGNVEHVKQALLKHKNNGSNKEKNKSPKENKQSKDKENKKKETKAKDKAKKDSKDNKKEQKQSSKSAKSLEKSRSKKEREKKGKKNDTSELPTTGEQQQSLWIAIGLFAIGVLLSGYNLYQKYKERKRQNTIELD